MFFKCYNVHKKGKVSSQALSLLLCPGRRDHTFFKTLFLLQMDLARGAKQAQSQREILLLGICRRQDQITSGFHCDDLPLHQILLKNPISVALFLFIWHLISEFGCDLSDNLKANCITIFRGLNIQCWCMSPFDPSKTSAHAREGSKSLSLAALRQQLGFVLINGVSSRNYSPFPKYVTNEFFCQLVVLL